MGFMICVVCEIIIKTTKKKIIGCGDLKLILASSLFLGFECLLLGIFIGSVIAVIVEIPLSYNKKYRSGNLLPFGPYLSYGFIISYLFGTNIINFYLSLIGG
jgi:leader peptidase (prepilin peptidase)/N-methyltransferase